jgi:hypothetical protein
MDRRNPTFLARGLLPHPLFAGLSLGFSEMAANTTSRFSIIGNALLVASSQLNMKGFRNHSCTSVTG